MQSTASSIPLPALELRQIVGPTDPIDFDNPGGEPIYKDYGLPLESYYWIRHNLPQHAIVAADPRHVVNLADETIGSTDFLSGMIERDLYYQRQSLYDPPETEMRRQQLEGLFSAASVTSFKALLAQQSFDYLLVYPDTPPAIGLDCCRKIV